MKHNLELTQKQIDLVWEMCAHVAFRSGKDADTYQQFCNLSEELENLTTDPNTFDNLLEMVYDNDIEESYLKIK